MAEVVCNIGTELPDGQFEDGDPRAIYTDTGILKQHAQIICSKGKAGFNNYGLRPADCLLEVYMRNMKTYKLERVGQNTTVKRTNLITQEIDVIPDGTSDQEVARITKHPNHTIFGTPRFEYWFAGCTRKNVPAVWDEIENLTSHVRSNYKKGHYVNPMSFRHHFIVTINDITEAQLSEYLKSLNDDFLKIYDTGTFRLLDQFKNGIDAQADFDGEVPKNRSALISRALPLLTEINANKPGLTQQLLEDLAVKILKRQKPGAIAKKRWYGVDYGGMNEVTTQVKKNIENNKTYLDLRESFTKNIADIINLKTS